MYLKSLKILEGSPPRISSTTLIGLPFNVTFASGIFFLIIERKSSTLAVIPLTLIVNAPTGALSINLSTKFVTSSTYTNPAYPQKPIVYLRFCLAALQAKVTPAVPPISLPGP